MSACSVSPVFSSSNLVSTFVTAAPAVMTACFAVATLLPFWKSAMVALQADELPS